LSRANLSIRCAYWSLALSTGTVKLNRDDVPGLVALGVEGVVMSESSSTDVIDSAVTMLSTLLMFARPARDCLGFSLILSCLPPRAFDRLPYACLVLSLVRFRPAWYRLDPESVQCRLRTVAGALTELASPHRRKVGEALLKPELTEVESDAMHARIDQLLRLHDSRSTASKDLSSVPMHLMKDKNTRERFDLYLKYQEGRELVPSLRASLADDTFAQGESSSSDLPLKLREVSRAVKRFLEDKCRSQVFAYKNLRHLADLKNLDAKTPGFPRVVHFHEGPTNSGKTYSAMQALRTASRGVYCGPLRLLAWQCYEDLLAMGLDTDLLTGQEHIRGRSAEGSEPQVDLAPEATETGVGSHLSCTVEMCPGPGSVEYDVGVIDEVQL
ncbi:hypothetical protein FOZ63_004228, partial [Perkinsus olseni]